MTKFNVKRALDSPLGIFIFYSLGAFIIIVALNFLDSSNPPPLPIFWLRWRLILGADWFIRFFPAIAMSALVFPWGVMEKDPDREGRPFSSSFMDTIQWPIITAIIAACLNGVLFFMAHPVSGAREAMQAQGALYRESEGKALEAAAEENWEDAAKFLSICDRIWPLSPSLEALRRDVIAAAPEDIWLLTLERPEFYTPEEEDALGSSVAVRNPVDAEEALDFGEAAFREERYYDAHWLATLAFRLAQPGSLEKQRDAPSLLNRAWNAISVLSPTEKETERYTIFAMKTSGYEATLSEDWIRGYYTFQELANITPMDPDVVSLLNRCKQKLAESAFFTDEMDDLLGNALDNALFSIPQRNAAGEISGRLILRIRSLRTYAGRAYGRDVEALLSNQTGRLIARMEAPYVKLISSFQGGLPKVTILLHALDRNDSAHRWSPQWTIYDPEWTTAPPQSQIMPHDETITLDMTYEDLLIMLRAKLGGLTDIQIPELFRAEKSLEPFGYLPQTFRAELIRRIAEPGLLFPGMILAVIIGWRFRAKRTGKFAPYLTSFFLPIVFYDLLHLYRAGITMLGIGMALTLNTLLALGILTAIILALFIIALIILSAQHA